VSFAEYITALIEALETFEPSSFSRLKALVGEKKARLQLDDEVINVGFVEGQFAILPVDEHTDGEGVMDSASVVRILDGHLEVTDSILSGHIMAKGTPSSLEEILIAIELILEASIHTPQFRALSEQFRSEKFIKGTRSNEYDITALFETGEKELDLLARLDLLP